METFIDGLNKFLLFEFEIFFLQIPEVVEDMGHKSNFEYFIVFTLAGYELFDSIEQFWMGGLSGNKLLQEGERAPNSGLGRNWAE